MCPFNVFSYHLYIFLLDGLFTCKEVILLLHVSGLVIEPVRLLIKDSFMLLSAYTLLSYALNLLSGLLGLRLCGTSGCYWTFCWSDIPSSYPAHILVRAAVSTTLAPDRSGVVALRWGLETSSAQLKFPTSTSHHCTSSITPWCALCSNNELRWRGRVGLWLRRRHCRSCCT